MELKKTSPAFSFDGWDIWEFVKGRKRSAVALVTTGLLYLTTDNEFAALLAGFIVEGAWSIIEYWYTKRAYVQTTVKIN